jgi:DNA-binding response OmpR family regulator
MTPPTILVIDDDDAILELLQTLLSEAGYQVKAGRDVTAVYEIEKDPPALLLIDNWLDGKSGHDICLQLKNDPRTANIPVILISAIPKLAETAQRCRADDFIAKPFDVAVLLRKVAFFVM